MFRRWICRPVILGLGLGATLAAALAGCGNQPTDSSDVNVVLPEPTAKVSSRSPASGTAVPATGTSAEAATGAPSSSSSSAPAKAEGWGTLKGQILFGGTPEPAKVLQEKGKAAKDPDMCAVNAPIMDERLVVDAATKGVKNVLVYLPRPTAINEDAKKAVTGKTVAFDQKNCIFSPHVLGLMTNVPVALKSSDSKNHNVNVKLKQSTFNSTVAGGQTIVFTPLGAERSPGQVICDIHPWMKAWWMVLDHPYFAVTDEKGNYEIKNVPAGAPQRVVVWQEAVKSGGFVTPPSGEDVTIKADGTTVKDFTIDPGKLLPSS
ncbi:MAG: hypothetical protein ACHRXM_33675 [Isosphaerales bacterium]